MDGLIPATPTSSRPHQVPTMESRSSNPPLFLLTLIFALCCFLSVLKQAEASNHLYIVYLGEKKHEDPNLVTASHQDILSSVFESKETALGSIVYNYKHGFSGFAAMLSDAQAKKLAELPEVISVKRNQIRRWHTTRSWDFLGQNYYGSSSLVHQANYGEDIIIGVVDTGIWPESESFNDKGYGPIPARWRGTCVTGESFDANNCSRKLIGARWYTVGIDASEFKGEFMSARDAHGHGTHTASTAAGSLVSNVSFHGLAAGAVRGGAPRARLAIYKACWFGHCPDAAVLAARDDAIYDGVDVLSLSIAGSEESQGTLHAVARGITIVFSAGNSGPIPQTMANSSPWVITVAASTIDRSFPTVIKLGNNKKLIGQATFYRTATHKSKFTEIVYGRSCDAESPNATNGSVAGKIVLCYLPTLEYLSPPRKYVPGAVNYLLSAGASGIIYAQYTTNILEILQQCRGVPCVLVDSEIARQISIYVAAEKVDLIKNTPVVKIETTRNVVGREVLAPKVAAFSSRGPSPTFPGILNPDIAAPGVSILAAKLDAYGFDSGTSMACPHVTGVVALLKSVHPKWSPAAIKSAIVTTASITDPNGLPIEAEGTPRKIADPFDFGGGHVNPDRAADPGLVYDMDPADYAKLFNCTLGPNEACETSVGPLYNLNLPSIALPDLTTAVVWRRVTNVGQADATYRAIVQPPPGVTMIVEPPVLAFNAANKVQAFKVTFEATVGMLQGDYTFGSLTWVDDGKHAVRIPIATRLVIEDNYADTA